MELADPAVAADVRDSLPPYAVLLGQQPSFLHTQLVSAKQRVA